MEYLSVLFVVSSLFVAESSQNKTDFNCTAQKTCGACVALSPQCHWCKLENYNGDRCNLQTVLEQTNCKGNDAVSPKSEHNRTRHVEPRNAIGAHPPIQLAPQEIRIKLRPNDSFQFRVDFRQADNYPVDVYFILDVSHTMKPYKEVLSNLSETLVTSIQSITTDFRIGFGSFVDKTILPYVLTDLKNEIEEKCINKSECSPPYGFKNQLRLTQNETEFKQRVSDLKIAGNLDAPEGGFDAIMQAIACTDDIGWREQSRKMILFSTDGSFHYAGDGKLGGIVIPNDGNCHLTREGFYGESNNQDYPSISQLAQKISEKKVNVIFIVPAKQVDLYKRLSDHILGSNVGQLASDASNVIDLVKENYDRIRNAVELKEQDLGDLKIAYQVKCPSGVRNIPYCDRVGIGESVSFNVTIEAKSCPSDRSQWNKAFTIYPVGLTEKLTVNVELICECPCEKPGATDLVPNSPRCNTSGTYKCGICACNRGFYGNKCECGAANLDDGESDMPCRLTNTSELVCEGRGQCECGQCVCGPINQDQPKRRYSGSHCQCNDYSCGNYDNQPCGGSSRGVCACGKCKCNDEHIGDSCECPSSPSLCKGSKGLICSGNGDCICGVCHCREPFKGTKCEDCPTCQGKCDEHSRCVVCHFRDTKDQCLSNCEAKNKTTHLVSDLIELPEWRQCTYSDTDTDNCYIYFAYNYKTNAVNVTRTKVCPYRASNLAIILSVIGGVIALGIVALLIWKVVVTLHDKREYEAFVEEQSRANWPENQNPIYNPATTNFHNPTYRPGSTINH